MLVCGRPGPPRVLRLLVSQYSRTQFALKDKPANVTKGEKRISKFSVLGELKEKKVKTEEQLLKLERERRERELRKKEIREKQLEIQKKRDQQKKKG